MLRALKISEKIGQKKDVVNQASHLQSNADKSESLEVTNSRYFCLLNSLAEYRSAIHRSLHSDGRASLGLAPNVRRHKIYNEQRVAPAFYDALSDVPWLLSHHLIRIYYPW